MGECGIDSERLLLFGQQLNLRRDAAAAMRLVDAIYNAGARKMRLEQQSPADTSHSESQETPYWEKVGFVPNRPNWEPIGDTLKRLNRKPGDDPRKFLERIIKDYKVPAKKKGNGKGVRWLKIAEANDALRASRRLVEIPAGETSAPEPDEVTPDAPRTPHTTLDDSVDELIRRNREQAKEKIRRAGTGRGKP
jgi:hypothetical protein